MLLSYYAWIFFTCTNSQTFETLKFNHIKVKISFLPIQKFYFSKPDCCTISFYWSSCKVTKPLKGLDMQYIWKVDIYLLCTLTHSDNYLLTHSCFQSIRRGWGWGVGVILWFCLWPDCWWQISITAELL